METIKESEIILLPNKRLGSGSEGTTYNTELGIYKQFKDNVSLEDRQLKIQKIYLINSIDLVKKFFPEFRYIVEDNQIQGYIMEQIQGFGLASHHYTQETQLSILRTIIKRLRKIYSHGILYLDLRDPNIIIDDDNNPRIIDADSIWTPSLPQNINSGRLNQYLDNGGCLDDGALNLMFNSYTTEVLYRHKMQYDKTGEKILKQLVKSKPHSYADQELLIDHIKR